MRVVDGWRIVGAAAAAALALAAAAAADTPADTVTQTDPSVPPATTTVAAATTTLTATATTTTTAAATTVPASTAPATTAAASTGAATTTPAATTTAPVPATTAATTTTAPVTTVPADIAEPPVTTAAAKPASPRPARTTTASTTTAATSTTTAASTLPAATVATAPAAAAGCVVDGAVGIALPGGRVLMLSAPASERGRATPSFAYPEGGAIATVAGASAVGNCGGSLRGSAAVSGVSLFRGAVTASRVSLAVHGEAAPAGEVDGLRVDGRAVTLLPGGHVRLGAWGELVEGPEAPLRTPAAAVPAVQHVGAFSIVLLQPHAGLPAGTELFVPFAGVHPLPAPKPAKRISRPLTVTPPIHGGPYDFPVAGAGASFGDSYGGARSDVSGGWHHGDDIFAPLGTPVVAVADGTLNRVGWEVIGGWRLWVRDDAGDEFYYAHLSGYTALALRGGRVRAGQVLGFVGNTGDAFTTEPHLHFEVHPRSLLHLHYDGAVDPTGYLDGWKHLAHVDATVPLHPKLPRASAARLEATKNWRELLSARHVVRHHATKHRASAPARPRPSAATRSASASVVPSVAHSSRYPYVAVTGAAAFFVLALGVAMRFGRRRLPPPV